LQVWDALFPESANLYAGQLKLFQIKLNLNRTTGPAFHSVTAERKAELEIEVRFAI